MPVIIDDVAKRAALSRIPFEDVREVSLGGAVADDADGSFTLGVSH